MSSDNRYFGDMPLFRSLPSHFGRTCSFLTALALAGCMSGQNHGTGAKSPTQESSQTIGAVAPASAPGVGQGFSNYGRPLTKSDFLRLTLGNTLFRPLADGGKTRIYVSPTGHLAMRITNPTGQTAAETGDQIVNAKDACWSLKGQTKPLCFIPYWNGRLLTLQFNDSNVLPAQFLVEQGEHLS
jgi:hypothetical protein